MSRTVVERDVCIAINLVNTVARLCFGPIARLPEALVRAARRFLAEAQAWLVRVNATCFLGSILLSLAL